VTGASGYIGGRLVPELLARGYRVRVMVRAPSPEIEQGWPDAEIVVGDVLDGKVLDRVLEGVHTAYYLIHSLVRGPKRFEAADLKAAENFRDAAERNKLQRIIYLGGLGATYEHLSHHLRSRLQVAQALERGRVPLSILRAAVIIGSGSASYEIILNLVRNLPVIFVPVWARNKCQPIGVRDVIKYLVGILETPETTGLSFDIGGRDVLTYETMLKILAEILGKKRKFITSPISNINFYSYFASLFTPVPAPITMCLMEGLKNDAIVQDDAIKRYVPFEPLSYREAIERSLDREVQDRVATRWSNAYPPAHELATKLHELEKPPRYKSVRSCNTERKAESIFESFCHIGGRTGWFHTSFLWRMRGVIDRLFFGVGTARGRRSSASLQINDVVDFWRVEDLKATQRLLLRAEIKAPGKAWLEFDITPENEGNRLTITAYFDTQSIWGKLYWYLFLPFHYFIFSDLLKQFAKCGKEERSSGAKA
jgi:uncharacterized protein YbjT (DUF2867 family)